jgi:hypothetical protein
LLPVTFACDIDIDQAMTIGTARAMALTETGRQALARMGLKPEEATITGSMVTFNSAVSQAEDERLHQRNLAMTSVGRSMLADRGMTPAEIDSISCGH